MELLAALECSALCRAVEPQQQQQHASKVCVVYIYICKYVRLFAALIYARCYFRFDYINTV